MELIQIERKDAIKLIKLLNKGFELNEVTAKIIDGFLFIRTLDKQHTMLVNLIMPVGSDLNNKYIKINFENLNKIKNTKENTINLKVDETEPKEVNMVKTNYENLNKLTIEIKEFYDFIKACEIMKCDDLRIVDDLIIAYYYWEYGAGSKTRVIKQIDYMKKQEVDVGMSHETLNRLSEFMKEFNEKDEMDLYFGKENGEYQPFLINIKNNESEFQIYFAPREREYPPIIDSKYV
jgi:hypothetical protein